VSLDEAINAIGSDTPLDYDGKFIQERDLTFLTEFKKNFGLYIKRWK
jgi:hypothetical protein